MTRISYPLFLLYFFVSTNVIAQKGKASSALLQKYFIALPYEKTIEDWVDEIIHNEKVSLDSTRKTDSVNQTFLRGYIDNWFVFERLDSIKFYVGNSFTRRLELLNRKWIGEVGNSFTYLREIFYFPLQTVEEKEWKETLKRVQKEFEKRFTAWDTQGGRLSSKSAKLIWFTDAYQSFSMPTVEMEYGKIEERKLRYIVLQLNFKAESVE